MVFITFSHIRCKMAIIVVQAKNMQKWYISGDDFNLEEVYFRSLKNPCKDSTCYLFMESIKKWSIPMMILEMVSNNSFHCNIVFFYLEGVGTLCSSCTQAKFKRPSIWNFTPTSLFHQKAKPHFTDDFNWGGPLIKAQVTESHSNLSFGRINFLPL